MTHADRSNLGCSLHQRLCSLVAFLAPLLLPAVCDRCLWRRLPDRGYLWASQCSCYQIASLLSLQHLGSWCCWGDRCLQEEYVQTQIFIDLNRGTILQQLAWRTWLNVKESDQPSFAVQSGMYEFFPRLTQVYIGDSLYEFDILPSSSFIAELLLRLWKYLSSRLTAKLAKSLKIEPKVEGKKKDACHLAGIFATVANDWEFPCLKTQHYQQAYLELCW